MPNHYGFNFLFVSDLSSRLSMAMPYRKQLPIVIWKEGCELE